MYAIYDSLLIQVNTILDNEISLAWNTPDMYIRNW